MTPPTRTVKSPRSRRRGGDHLANVIPIGTQSVIGGDRAGDGDELARDGPALVA